MLYYFVKLSLLLYSRIYFKRIYISGVENIPQDRPVFLASNHSNGFLDGTMVSSLLIPKATRIFVRGDVFNQAWSNLLLRQIKLIPIYRARDGGGRNVNNKSYDQLYSEFLKNRVVLIFPEADAQIEKRIRPLKKGMARMILDMQSRGDGEMEVAVVPFGLNYTYYKKYRNELMISFAKPVYLKDYEEEGDAERDVYSKMTKDVGRKIEAEMVSVRKEDDEVTETALCILRAEWKDPLLKFWIPNRKRLTAEIAVADQIKSDESSELKASIEKYQSTLDKNEVTEDGSKPIEAWKWLFLLVFGIPSILSWAVMGWGLFAGKKIVDAVIRKDELYDSVWFGVGLVYNWILIFVGYPIAYIYFGWKGIVGWFLFRCLSITFQHCRDFWVQIVNRQKWNTAKTELDSLRTDVLNQLKY